MAAERSSTYECAIMLKSFISHFSSFFFSSSNTATHLGHPGIRSKYASLTVLVSPDPPKILQGDFILTTEEREIELECISENGKPAAEVYVYVYPSVFIVILFHSVVSIGHKCYNNVNCTFNPSKNKWFIVLKPI